MTYFHKRTFTIIGAKAFHCPVRDGKEWDHLAMVVRRKGLGGQRLSSTLPNLEEARRVARVSHRLEVTIGEQQGGLCLTNSFYINGTCRYCLISGHKTYRVIGSSRTGN